MRKAGPNDVAEPALPSLTHNGGSSNSILKAFEHTKRGGIDALERGKDFKARLKAV